MLPLRPSSSQSSLSSTTSRTYAPPSPESVNSASSSKMSLDQQDEGMDCSVVTRSMLKKILVQKILPSPPNDLPKGSFPNRRVMKSMLHYSILLYINTQALFRDLRLLAISTHMTELSYMISDIQTRIFGTVKYLSIAVISANTEQSI